MKLLVTRYPFGKESKSRLEELSSRYGFEIVYTGLRRECNNGEVRDFLQRENPDIILAGTERYDKYAFGFGGKLKMISRVGIGLNSIDLKECERRKIIIGNGMGYMANSVSELAIYHIISCLRRTIESDSRTRNGEWDRYIGRDLSLSSVGIIGYGRIGKTMGSKLKNLAGQIYLHDIDPKRLEDCSNDSKVLDLDHLLRESDIVTLHIPMNEYNENFISKDKLKRMKKNAILINTSRSELINEDDLYNHLLENRDFYAALDVPPSEPYKGKLRELPNCYFTSHLGSCTEESARTIESEGIENIRRYLDGERVILLR